MSGNPTHSLLPLLPCTALARWQRELSSGREPLAGLGSLRGRLGPHPIRLPPLSARRHRDLRYLRQGFSPVSLTSQDFQDSSTQGFHHLEPRHAVRLGPALPTPRPRILRPTSAGTSHPGFATHQLPHSHLPLAVSQVLVSCCGTQRCCSRIERHRITQNTPHPHPRPVSSHQLCHSPPLFLKSLHDPSPCLGRVFTYF